MHITARGLLLVWAVGVSAGSTYMNGEYATLREKPSVRRTPESLDREEREQDRTRMARRQEREATRLRTEGEFRRYQDTMRPPADPWRREPPAGNNGFQAPYSSARDHHADRRDRWHDDGF